MNNDSNTLVGKKVFPVISITLPIHPQYPEIKVDSEHLVSVLKNVSKQLHSKYSKDRSTEMMTKLTDVLNKIPVNHLSKSLLIYVTPDSEKIFHLPLSLTEKVIVDSSFEIRDLLYATQMNKHYLLVMISQNSVKTFIGNTFQMTSLNLPGMPDNVHDVFNEHSFPGRDYLDSRAFEEKNIRNYLRFIDEVLEKESQQNSFPVIVMGDVKLMGYFKQHSRNQKNIVGYVEGNYEHVSNASIREKVEPIIKKMCKEEEEAFFTQMQSAVSHGLLCTGITEVWRAAVEGKGRTLMVEKDYRVKARRGIDEYTIAIDEYDINPHDILNDAVDDVIEIVLKNKGDIYFTENDTLKEYDRIALISRH